MFSLCCHCDLNQSVDFGLSEELFDLGELVAMKILQKLQLTLTQVLQINSQNVFFVQICRLCLRHHVQQSLAQLLQLALARIGLLLLGLGALALGARPVARKTLCNPVAHQRIGVGHFAHETQQRALHQIAQLESGQNRCRTVQILLAQLCHAQLLLCPVLQKRLQSRASCCRARHALVRGGGARKEQQLQRVRIARQQRRQHVLGIAAKATARL